MVILQCDKDAAVLPPFPIGRADWRLSPMPCRNSEVAAEAFVLRGLTTPPGLSDIKLFVFVEQTAAGPNK
jgi:hypothetical protein